MKDTKSPNSKQLSKINLERIKKFFVFLVVFLFAVFALMVLQNEKELFDKSQKAPFIVISDDDDTSKATAKKLHVRPIKVGELTAEIERSFDKQPTAVQGAGSSNLAAADAAASTAAESLVQNAGLEDNNEKQSTIGEKSGFEERKKRIKQDKIIPESVAELQYRHFTNDIELINALNGEILRRKDGQLKLDETSLDKSVRLEYDFAEKKDAASRELDSIISSGNTKTFDIKVLLKTLAPDSPLYAALTEESKNPKKTPYLPDDLKKIVTDFYKKKTNALELSINQIRERIRNTGQDYQLVIKSIYTTLKVEGKLDTLAPSHTTYKDLKQILDEKGSLNVIYKFVWIVLTALIVFSLLYLILIPLKYIYSLTGAGEAINNQSEKLLEPKAHAGSAAASLLGNSAARAAIVTVAAVGVGTVALASGNPFSSAPAAKNADQSNFSEAVINASRPTFEQNSKGGNNLYNSQSNVNQLSINELTASIISLQTNVGNLQKQIAEMKLGQVETITRFYPVITDGKDYSGDIASLGHQIALTRGLIRNPENLNDTSTVFGQLGEIEQRFNTKIDRTIGTAASPADSPTLFGNLKAFSNLIGTPTSANRSRKIFDELGNLSTTIGTRGDKAGNDTLVGDLKQVSDKTAAIDATTKSISGVATDVKDTTTDIRLNQFGRDGKNILTQSRTLLSPERYRITQPVYDALEKVIGTANPKLLASLKALINGAEMSDGELFKKIIENQPDIRKKDLKPWRERILRYSRVPRW